MQPAPLPAALAALDLRLTAILMALQPLVAHHFLRHPWVSNAVTVPLWNRLGRYARRLSRLVAAFAAGRLPACRAPRRLSEPARHAAAATPRPLLPRTHGWMLHALGHHAAVHRNRLEALLAEPIMAEFLAAAPGAGRILRPLCHMLGVRHASPGLPPPPLAPRAPQAATTPRPPPLGLSPLRPRIAAPLHPLTAGRARLACEQA